MPRHTACTGVCATAEVELLCMRGVTLVHSDGTWAASGVSRAVQRRDGADQEREPALSAAWCIGELLVVFGGRGSGQSVMAAARAALRLH